MTMQQGSINTSKSLLFTLLNEPLTFLGGLLLFLMTFSPTYNVAIKITLIAILLISVILSRVIFFKLNVTKEVFLWYMIFICHGIFFTLLGFMNGNNSYYVLRTTTYNILWPLLYFIFTIGLYKKTSLIFFIRILIISNSLIALYLIGSALTLLGILPGLGFINFSMAEIAWDFSVGLAKIEVPAIISMMFTLPFVISLTMLSGKRSFGFGKWFLYASVLLSVIAAILTVRRALMLNVILGIFFTIIFSWWARRENRRILYKNIFRIAVAGFIVLAVILVVAERSGFVDVSLIFQKFTGAFASKENLTDESVAIRYNQFNLLLKSWLQRPLIGHGHGAVSDFIVRSEKTPWIYELTYAALLFQTGAIGLIIYFLLLGWPIYKGLQLVKKGSSEIALLVIPLSVGCICFLVANATNPYLQSYDCMWTVFLPIAILNYFMKEQHV
jgi:hypothetical protein